LLLNRSSSLALSLMVHCKKVVFLQIINIHIPSP
jgi:hypothetical protein